MNSSKSDKRIASAETADEKDWKAEEDKKELEFVHDRLKQIEQDFGVSKEMVCTIWTEVSGELSKVRQALDGKNVKKWSFII